MKVNPELQRNLWLELTPLRLIGMPAVLVATFILIALLAPDSRRETLVIFSLVLYGALVFLWGTRQASESVIIEVRDRTWDGQRMSSIGPWSMTWGKLFGSAVYPWYGGLLCLLSYAFLTGGDPQVRTTAVLALFLSCGLLAHATALLSSMQAMIKERRYNRSQTAAFLMLGVMFIWPFLGAGLSKTNDLEWMGMNFRGLDFSLMTVLLFLFWTVLGIYRLMRTELQIKNGPLVWIAFACFLALYFAGFQNAADSGHRVFDRFVTGYFVAVLTMYLMAVGERKDPVAFRRLIAAYDRGDRMALLQDLPCWSLTLVPVLVAACGTILTSGMGGSVLQQSPGLPLFIVASVLFLARDIGLLLFLNLAQSQKRSDMLFLLALVLLYGVVPGILSAAGLDRTTVLFWPRWDISSWISLGAAGGEAVIIAVLVRRRWQGRYAVPQRPLDV